MPLKSSNRNTVARKTALAAKRGAPAAKATTMSPRAGWLLKSALESSRRCADAVKSRAFRQWRAAAGPPKAVKALGEALASQAVL